MSHVRYAGVTLYQPTPQIELDLYAHLRPQLATIWQHNTWGDQATYARQHWAMASHAPNHPFELGSLYWPVGAARWAYGHWLVNDTDLDTILAATIQNGVPVPQILSLETVEAEMYLLPTIPQYVAGSTKVRVLTLVDERYWWWYKNATIAIDYGNTSWDDLIDEIGTALGKEILRGTVNPAYLTPGVGLEARQDSLPLLLDAVAYNIGRRVVREVDGTVTLMDVDQSRLRESVNLEEVWMVGGPKQLSPDGLERALVLPRRVTVRFPRPKCYAWHSVTATLAGLGLQEGSGITGFDGDKLFHDTLFANSETGTPPNQAVLQALVNQVATDWYRLQLGREFVQYREIVDILPHALMDSITWRANGDDCSTTVYPPSNNDQVEELCHGGKPHPCDEGLCVSGSFNPIGSACPQVVAVAPTSTQIWCVSGTLSAPGSACPADTGVETVLIQDSWCGFGTLDPSGDACLITPEIELTRWCVSGSLNSMGVAYSAISLVADPDIAWCVSGSTSWSGLTCPVNIIQIGCGLKYGVTTSTLMVKSLDLVDPIPVGPSGLEVNDGGNPLFCGIKIKTGCGTTIDATTNELRVNPFDLVIDPDENPTGLSATTSSCTLFVQLGCPLKFGEFDQDGKIVLDTRLLIGLESPFDGNRANGLEAVPFTITETDCYYLKIATGCHLFIDNQQFVGLDAYSLIGKDRNDPPNNARAGLIVQPSALEGCYFLEVNPGCGLIIDENKVKVNRGDLLGPGLKEGTDPCNLTLDIGSCFDLIANKLQLKIEGPCLQCDPDVGLRLLVNPDGCVICDPLTGLDVDVDSDAGCMECGPNGLKVKVQAGHCIECTDQGLAVQVKEGGGILCDGQGLQIDPNQAGGNGVIVVKQVNGATTPNFVQVFNSASKGWASLQIANDGPAGLDWRITITTILGAAPLVTSGLVNSGATSFVIPSTLVAVVSNVAVEVRTANGGAGVANFRLRASIG